MKTTSSYRWFWMAAALVTAGCATPRLGATGALEAAALEVHRGEDAPRALALAGFHAALLESKPEQAVALWERAAKGEPDAWALYGMMEAARRALDDRTRARAALQLCRTAPRHPLCAVAARTAVAAVGQSPNLDAEIEAGAMAALEASPPGEAAFFLRLAAATVRGNRGDLAGQRALFAEAGVVDQASLVGPWSRFRCLEWDAAFAPERGELRGSGPFGTIQPREARAPDGHFALHAEPGAGDVFFWAADVQIEAGGRYLLRARSDASFRLYVDGTALAERRTFERRSPEERTVELDLSAGRHRLLAKVARTGERADLWLSLARADGAPARARFAAATEDAAPSPPVVHARPSAAYPDAGSLAAALEPEAGAALAAFVAAREAAERDSEGARALVESLVAALGPRPRPPSLLVLDAELALADGGLPQRLARGQADRDLERALERDPKEASALQRLSIHARGDGRFDEASERLERARAAAPGSWRVALSEVRLALARGADAAAEQAAQKALAIDPDLCDALGVRYDLAKKADAFSESDALLARLARCPGQDRRAAEHFEARGKLAEALAAVERLAAERPLDPGPAQKRAELLLGLDRPADAARIYEALSTLWPRESSFLKRRADALELAGDARGARAAREAALAVDGADLKLRRALAWEDRKEVLDDLRRDGASVIERYRRAAPAESAPTMYLLDASALDAHPDGSFTERTHVVAKALDQRGVGQLAEVQLPGGAELLALRTLKKDGRVLEPEAIGGKDGVSLPGVEVGDLIEYEYLATTPAREAAAGFAGPKFYLRIVDGQIFESIYEVRAPIGARLEVDAHNGVELPAPRVEDGSARLTLERRDLAPFVPEPGGPTTDEVLPFVQAGAGAGEETVLAGFSDYLLDRSSVDGSIAAWARQAAGPRVGLDAVRALHARLMEDVKGPESSLATTAAATLAQGRGSRTQLMKAALAALNIPARLALVLPYSASPARYRFPNVERFSEAVLLVTLPTGEVWLDLSTRFAPFGELGPQSQAQPAAILPHPGEAVRMTTTPGAGAAPGKRVTLALQLAVDGSLTGRGEEIYSGFEAAYLRTALERLDAEQRRQAVESAVARSFDHATLREVTIDAPETTGAPVTIRFDFVAPAFARVDGKRLLLENGLYPSQLSRRFLSLSERRTPLLIANPERLELAADLTLPPGWKLATSPQPALRTETPFGLHQRTEGVVNGKLVVREVVELTRQRVASERYGAFGEFLSGVDHVQARGWVFERLEEKPPVPAPPLR